MKKHFLLHSVICWMIYMMILFADTEHTYTNIFFIFILFTKLLRFFFWLKFSMKADYNNRNKQNKSFLLSFFCFCYQFDNWYIFSLIHLLFVLWFGIIFLVPFIKWRDSHAIFVFQTSVVLFISIKKYKTSKTFNFYKITALMELH